MPASRAPGVSSEGIMRAVMASISTACSGEKNWNFAGVADLAAWCACSAAATIAGQCAESHTALTAPPARVKKLRRLRSLSMSEKELNIRNLGWSCRGVKEKRPDERI